MWRKSNLMFTGAIFLSLALTSCGVSTSSDRETIFDKIVNIPKEFILDIPQLPPLCDEAIKYYQNVLQNFKEKCNCCTQADRKWLKERLKTPFKWD